MTTTTTTDDVTHQSFSEAIKAASWQAHGHAEQSPYLKELLAGNLSRAAYAELVAQQRFVYLVLEDAARTMGDDPLAGPFVDDALVRVPALDADLAHLLGPGWAEGLRPTPATATYCDRLREVAFDWPGGFVAHHYVRYLGDLSGGQVIGRILARVFGFEHGEGLAFYAFDGISDAKAWKQAYRDRLDATPWDAEERARITDEVLLAYRLNTELLDSLAVPGA